jgi:hypothetical protein
MYKGKPLLGANFRRDHPYQKNLSLFYLFNEGGGNIVTDIQSRVQGTLSGFTHSRGSGWYGSLFGSGIQFNGSPNWITLGQKDYCQGSFSISAWIKILATADANGSYIFTSDQSLGTGTAAYVRFAYTQARNLFLKVGSNNSSVITISTNTLNLDTWYHVVATCDSTGTTSTVNIYVNGIKAGTTGSGSHQSIVVANKYCGIGAIDYIHTTPLVIGYVQGYIDHLRLYDKRVLTTDDIMNLYNEPFDDFDTQTKKYYLLPSGTPRSYGFIIG